MVGLPYPNKNDPVLKEKMKYINDNTSHVSGGDIKRLFTEHSYYENLCMRAVNQSIGRAIRHAQVQHPSQPPHPLSTTSLTSLPPNNPFHPIKDYATILLVDGRYTRKEVVERLPKWIGQTLKGGDAGVTFGEAFGGINAFFQTKKPNQLRIEMERRGAAGRSG